MDGGSHARLGMFSKLRDAYGSREAAVGGVHSLCPHSTGGEGREEETGDRTNKVRQDTTADINMLQCHLNCS